MALPESGLTASFLEFSLGPCHSLVTTRGPKCAASWLRVARSGTDQGRCGVTGPAPTPAMATTPVSLPVNQTSIWGVCDSGRRRKDLTSCSSQAQSPPLVEEGLPCARNCGSDTRGSGGARGRRVRAPRPGPCGAGGRSPISGAPSEKKDVTAAHDTENQRSGLTAALEDCRGHGAWRAISWGSKGQICSQRERGTPASGRVIPPPTLCVPLGRA